MAFLCPSRVGRATKNKTNKAKVPRLGGRLTGSDSIDSLVRVGLKKQHNFKPESKLIITQDFKARVDEELDVYRGQEVYFLYEESEWTYVLTDDDKEGFVPSVLCSKFTDIRPASVITQEEDVKSNGDVKSESSGSSIKKFSDPSFETDSFNTEKWSEFSKLSSSSSLKVETTVQEVRWFRKTSHGQFIVLFNFTALDENDISVERAELVEVLNIEDPDWSWIRRYNGEEGFVPKSYICPVEPLLAQEKVHQSHGKISQRNILLSNNQERQFTLDHKPERSFVNHCEPSYNGYPLTDAAKRENIAQSSAVQRQQQFQNFSNNKPISSTTSQTGLLKSIDINKQHHTNNNKHPNTTKFSNNLDKIRTEDCDNTFPGPLHSSEVGTKKASTYPNVFTNTKQFMENVPPEEPSKQELDKYRTAINAEIKQLGLLKKVSNSHPDSNLVPSKNHIKTLSNEPLNKQQGQQSNSHYNNQSRHRTITGSGNETMVQGMNQVRRTSPFRFKSSSNYGEGKSEEQENWVKNQIGTTNGLNNTERGRSASRPINDPSYRRSSPVRQYNSSVNRGPSPLRTSSPSTRGSSPVRQYNLSNSRGESPLRTRSPNTRGTSPARQNLVSSFGTNALNSPVNETASHGRQDSGISQISVNDTLKTCDITEFILMYDYIAQSKNDLTVKRGDIVYVDTADQNDQQWLWVYCPQWHKYGYVPRSYVKVPIKTTL